MMGPECNLNSKQISLSGVQYSADNWKMVQAKRSSADLPCFNVVSLFQLNKAAACSQILTQTTTTTNNNNNTIIICYHL
jgi:hypothetical protein